MRFTLAILLPALAIASPFALEARADLAKNITADIKTVNATLYQINATLNTFTPLNLVGVATALKIQKQTTALAAALQAAIDAANTTDALSTKESGQIASESTSYSSC